MSITRKRKAWERGLPEVAPEVSRTLVLFVLSQIVAIAILFQVSSE